MAFQGTFDAAQVLTASTPRHTGIACFLCRQAAEKALKAFLVWRQTSFRRSHDLDYLLNLCAAGAPEFEELRAAARTLTTYAADFRYPGRRADPPIDETHAAIHLAEAVVTFVVERLPEEVRPR